jgi:ribosomal protein L39E
VIATFYSETGDGAHTSVLAHVVTTLASRGHSVLCVDWDLAGGSLATTLGFPNVEYGVATLIAERSDADRYVQRVDYVDVLPAGRVGVAPATHAEWAALYRDDGLADFLEDCCDSWRKSYEIVMINGPAGNDGSRGIHLAHLPDVVVPVYTSASAGRTVETLRRVDAARDQLPYGRGRLGVVPVWVGERTTAAQLFEPWLRAWVPRAVPLSNAIAALAVRGRGGTRLLAELLAHELDGTTLISNLRSERRRYRNANVPRAWMAELAKVAIERAAPREARFFDLVADTYLDNPVGPVSRRQDAVLGIGAELLVDSMTQAAVYIAMRLLDAVIGDPPRRRWRRSAPDRTLDEAAANLSEDELRAARVAGLAAGDEIGVAPAQATMIVDAMLARLRGHSPQVLEIGTEAEGTQTESE